MAFGAVLLSLPLALAIACISMLGLDYGAAYFLAVYAFVGVASLASFTVAFGVRPKDFQ